jgi:malonyl-CoA O-methyltransferase
MTGNKPDRIRVRRNFEAGAVSYNHHARVQQRVAQQLTEDIAGLTLPAGPILEVGCGTGNLTRLLRLALPQCRMLVLDLAGNMIRALDRELRKDGAVVADARALPLATGSMALVCAASVYQWIPELPSAFGEAQRVLCPGGQFAFALFGRETLWELREAYGEAARACGRPLPNHLLTLPTMAEVGRSLSDAGLTIRQLEQQKEQDELDSVADLVRSLKQIGAQTAGGREAGGLTSRRFWQELEARYRRGFGHERGIPATYQVIYGLAEKR